MSANTKPEIRELSADELELVSGGNGLGTRAANTVGWWVAVAADYWFNASGGIVFHASKAAEEDSINAG